MCLPAFCACTPGSVPWWYMRMNDLWVFLGHVFPNILIDLLFMCAFCLIITWAFLRRLLNPFIDAVLAILGCAFEMLVTFFFLPIKWADKQITIHITQPILKLISRIHIPELLKHIVYTCLGVCVFYLDHRYNVQLFEYNETFAIYPFQILESKIWVSEFALLIGGFFFFLPFFYLLGKITHLLNWLLDRTMCINILVYR